MNSLPESGSVDIRFPCMGATFGAVAVAGASVPADCVLKSTSVKESVETYTYRDASGTTVKAVPGKMVTTECTLEVIGSAPLTITAGAFASGAYKQISAKVTEGNTEFPASSLVFKKFSNR